MSWIGNTPRPPAEPAQLGMGAEMQGGYAAPSGTGIAPAWANGGDAIMGAAQTQVLNALGSSSAGFGGNMSGFFGLVSSLFSQIQQYLSQALGSGSSSAAASQGYNPATSQASNPGQTYYASADASSVGDPHEGFNGTTGSGNTVGGKWDSMQSHQDLLSSDSFNGGYRVSTQATQPNSNGTTLNQSGTVTTAGGNTTVSLNANGQYAVTSYGRNVSLQQGQAVDLGNGENVTLNSDNSLTVNDSNGQGGNITTTLATNGSGGVDVKSNAGQVDLGGYLANRSDGVAAWPGPLGSPYGGFQPQFATLPQQAGQFTPAAGSYGTWSGGDALSAEQSVDPLLAG
jgi:hypothetical protein